MAMSTARLGRFPAILCFAFMLVACLAINGYLAYRIVYPPRTLVIRILLDPSNPPIPGMLPEQLQARVEALDGFFRRAAGIHIKVAGFTRFKLPAESFDPELLRHYVELHTPRENADVLIAFWPPPAGDQRLGSAIPYSAVAVTRIDGSDPDQRDQAILAHQILTLFGVSVSGDSNSVMHLPPGGMQLDSRSVSELKETRLFDFSQGLSGASRRMRSRILSSLELSARAEAKSPRVAFAELLMRDRLFSAAVEQYRVELRSAGNPKTAHLGLASALTQMGNYADAEAEARAAIQLAPREGDGHYRLGSVLVRAGNPEAAVAEFQQAIALQPNLTRNRTGLAVAYAASLGEFDAADREFHEALKLEPQNPMLLADIDFVNRLRGRLTKQLGEAEAKVHAHPESGQAHDQMALLLLRLGQVDKATTEAREALRLGPDTWHPHYTLALALYASRDYAGSKMALADAQRLGSGGRPYLEEALRMAATRPLQ